MKKMLMFAMASLFVGSFAIAQDEKHESETTTGHNIVTGTDSTKTVTEDKAPDGKGNVVKKKTKVVKKHHTNGKNTTSKSSEESSTPKE